MSDFIKCIIELQKHDADYMVCHYGTGHKVICFSPYEDKEGSIMGYVYNWIDFYDCKGELVEHKVFNER